MTSRLPYLLLCCVVALYCLPVYAQKLPFIYYTTAHGLSHNRTHVVKQDGEGYIWTGTDVGVNRYDGRNFRHYSCPDNPYRATRYATQYNKFLVFCVNDFGLMFCCGDSTRSIRLNIENIGILSGVIPLNDTTFYVINQATGLYYIKGRVTRHIVFPPPIVNEWNFVDIFRDRKGNIWILSTHGLLYLRHGDTDHPLSVPFFCKQYINNVKQDPHTGDIYVAYHFGVFRYTEAQTDSIATAVPEMILPAVAEVTSTAFDANDNVWMSSTIKGLYKYNKKTKHLDNYNIANGLISQTTWDVFCDKENNIWCTSENGLCKLASQNYFSFDFTFTDHQNLKSACVWNDSTLLFTNTLDMFAYVSGKVRKITGFRNVLANRDDILFKAPDNKLWTSTSTPIDAGSFNVHTQAYDLDNFTLNHYTPLLKLPGGAQEVFTDRGTAMIGNDLLVCSSKGLQLYSHASFKTLPELVINNKKKSITYMAKGKKDDVWMIHNYRTLARYTIHASASNKFPYVFQQEYSFTASNPGNARYEKIFVDSRGYIWFCSQGNGVYLLKTNLAGNIVKVDSLGLGALSSGIIIDIEEDDQNNVWIGTGSGLDKCTFKGDTLTIAKDVYSSQLCGKYIYFIRKMGDKMFVGTSGCLGVIRTTGKEYTTSPDIYLSGIKVNETNKNSLLSLSPRFQPDENYISFTFTGISFKDEHKIKYSYTLEGLDAAWSAPKPDHTITYSSIPPGTYTFKVKALSADGIWSAKPASFTFTIAQPFYTQWWFVSLVAVIISAIVYAIYRYRINQILQIQHIRQTISKDLHDDIGATVSSINILANMAKSDLVSESKRNRFLETIQEESKHVSDSLNDIVWSINPKNDSLEIMFARMHRYASELFEAKNIAYDFVLPQGPVSQLNMNMTRRQNIYLIFKEAVNNLAKYSAATTAAITFSVSNTRFSVIIADNGKGFDTSLIHGGNGIFNMKKRAEEINAQLLIDSVTGKGTRITLSITY